jgi:spore coat-associated protein N
MNTNKNNSSTKSKKQLMLSLALVGVVATSASIGTYAYFTATRTTQNNTFTAGTLDLNVNSNGTALEPFVIDNMGQNGTIGGDKTWNVKNTGSLPGRFYLRIQNLSNTENGCNDQEASIEPSCASNNEGELGDVVNLKVSVDGAEVASSTLATSEMATIGTKWSSYPSIIIQPNETKTVRALWSADESSYDNRIQSDAVKFDMNFRLIQNINGQQPAN